MKDFTEYPEALVDKQSFSHIFGDSLNIPDQTNRSNIQQRNN
jgi:hypothetical protein